MAARVGDRSLRIDMRLAAFGAAALAGLVALIFVAVAVNDVWVASALRARGVIAQGQRIGERCSDSRNGRGFSTRTCVGVWSYRAASGQVLTMHDLGDAATGPVETGPGWATPRDGQVAFLPDNPRTARLRTQVAPNLIPTLGGGGFFLLLAGVFGAAGYWLLGPVRPMAAPPPLSRAASRRRERRDGWIVRAMVIGVPLAAIAGMFLI